MDLRGKKIMLCQQRVKLSRAGTRSVHPENRHMLFTGIHIHLRNPWIFSLFVLLQQRKGLLCFVDGVQANDNLLEIAFYFLNNLFHSAAFLLQ